MANKGDYWKIKTKDWLQKKGYQVEYLEKLQRIYTKNKVIYIKKDIFASDLLAISKDEIIFVNSVLNKKNVASHIRGFMKYEFPYFVKRWVVIWTPRVKEPEIVEVTTDLNYVPETEK